MPLLSIILRWRWREILPSKSLAPSQFVKEKNSDHTSLRKHFLGVLHHFCTPRQAAQERLASHTLTCTAGRVAASLGLHSRHARNTPQLAHN